MIRAEEEELLRDFNLKRRPLAFPAFRGAQYPAGGTVVRLEAVLVFMSQASTPGPSGTAAMPATGHGQPEVGSEFRNGAPMSSSALVYMVHRRRRQAPAQAVGRCCWGEAWIVTSLPNSHTGAAIKPGVPGGERTAGRGPPQHTSDAIRMPVGPSCNGFTNTILTNHTASLSAPSSLVVWTLAAALVQAAAA